MNKTELEKELKKLQLALSGEKRAGMDFLKQQKWLKKLAENAGSETAKWKHECILLEEENNKLKNEIKLLKIKQVKK